MCRSAWSFLVVVNLIIFAPFSAGAEKTDSIVLRNGNRITGEIKSLENGLLSYKTDDMGTLSVQWEKITRISSKYSFVLEDVKGARYYGVIPEAPEPGKLVVQTQFGSVTLEMAQVVRIYEYEQQFFHRLKGYLDLGFSLQKANTNTQLNLATEVYYLSRKWKFTMTASSYFSAQEQVKTSTKNTLSLAATRLFQNRWNAVFLVQGQQNTELNLLLRVLAGGGIGRYLIQTNRHILNAAVGVDVGEERYYDSTSTTTNTEALLSLSYQSFKYVSPKLEFSAYFFVFPSLTTAGRVRINFQSNLRYELLHNFYVTLGFTDYYDSRPGEEATTKNDYGATLSISWSVT
jgi:Protein of unknown function, DUF481